MQNILNDYKNFNMDNFKIDHNISETSKFYENKEIEEKVNEEVNYQLSGYIPFDDDLEKSTQSSQITEKVESVKDLVIPNSKKTKMGHPCYKLGLSTSYAELKKNLLEDHKKNEKITSIKDSTFTQQYGDIHREDNQSECLQCKKEHSIKIFSSEVTNKYVALFQQEFLKIENKDKQSTMVGAATISFKNRIIKTYITHSGAAPETIKELYKNLGAKVIEHNVEKEDIISINDKSDIDENNENNELYAIHSNNALMINNGIFKTIFGEKLNAYNLNAQMEIVHEEMKKGREEKIKELETEIEEVKNSISDLKIKKEKSTKKKEIGIKISEYNKHLNSLNIILKTKKLSSTNTNDKEIKTIDMEEVKKGALKIFTAKFGTNFGNCAAQKIMQQISKDFGEMLNPKDYTINMSEAWIQLPSVKEESAWSKIHPVHSCETCAYIIPTMLCEKN